MNVVLAFSDFLILPFPNFKLFKFCHLPFEIVYYEFFKKFMFVILLMFLLLYDNKLHISVYTSLWQVNIWTHQVWAQLNEVWTSVLVLCSCKGTLAMQTIYSLVLIKALFRFVGPEKLSCVCSWTQLRLARSLCRKKCTHAISLTSVLFSL